MSFEEFMERVDMVLERIVGLSSDDLEDACYYDMFEDGFTPAQAAKAVLRNSMF